MAGSLLERYSQIIGISCSCLNAIVRREASDDNFRDVTLSEEEVEVCVLEGTRILVSPNIKTRQFRQVHTC